MFVCVQGPVCSFSLAPFVPALAWLVFQLFGSLVPLSALARSLLHVVVGRVRASMRMQTTMWIVCVFVVGAFGCLSVVCLISSGWLLRSRVWAVGPSMGRFQHLQLKK